MGGRAGGGASGGMGNKSRAGGNSQGMFTGTGGEVFYNGPGSKGWNKSVENVLKGGVLGMTTHAYMNGELDNDNAHTILAGVAAKSTGFQKDVATKGLKNMYNKGDASLSEKQAWAVAYEFNRIFGKKK